MHCELIVNHRSRKARQQAAALIQELVTAGFTLDKVYEVSKRYSLDTAIRAVKRRKPSLLVVGGGDGTVSHVVGRMAGASIEIGIVPLGTTNNFARGLKIPFNITEAVSVIKTCPGRAVDLGLLNGMYFANVAGIGVSAEIARYVTNRTKRRWGRLAYLITGVRRLARHKPFIVTLEDAQGNLRARFETHQVVVANGKYHAGKEIAQNAALDDGLLFVFGLGGASRLSFLKHTADFYFGTRAQIAHYSYYTGRDIKISTDTVQAVEVDGEVKKRTPLAISVEQAAIKVRHPA